MDARSLSGMGRMVTRVLKMARRIIDDAEKLGLDIPTRKRKYTRKSKPESQPPKKGRKTPLKNTPEEE